MDSTRPITTPIVNIEGQKQSMMKNHGSDVNFVNRLFWTWYKVDLNDLIVFMNHFTDF